MLKLDDFKKLSKSQILNKRFVLGGKGNPTEYAGGDDWRHEPGDAGVERSGRVPGGANGPEDDPRV